MDEVKLAGSLRLRTATRHGAPCRLGVREIEDDARVGIERLVLDASDHTDDGLPRVSGGHLHDVDALADGVFVGPVLLREVFVDDHDARVFRDVVLIEEAAAAQRDFIA
jgi:hypothetical protein